MRKVFNILHLLVVPLRVVRVRMGPAGSYSSELTQVRPTISMRCGFDSEVPVRVSVSQDQNNVRVLWGRPRLGWDNGLRTEGAFCSATAKSLTPAGTTSSKAAGGEILWLSKLGARWTYFQGRPINCFHTANGVLTFLLRGRLRTCPGWSEGEDVGVVFLGFGKVDVLGGMTK